MDSLSGRNNAAAPMSSDHCGPVTGLSQNGSAAPRLADLQHSTPASPRLSNKANKDTLKTAFLNAPRLNMLKKSVNVVRQRLENVNILQTMRSIIHQQPSAATTDSPIEGFLTSSQDGPGVFVQPSKTGAPKSYLLSVASIRSAGFDDQDLEVKLSAKKTIFTNIDFSKLDNNAFIKVSIHPKASEPSKAVSYEVGSLASGPSQTRSPVKILQNMRMDTASLQHFKPQKDPSTGDVDLFIKTTNSGVKMKKLSETQSSEAFYQIGYGSFNSKTGSTTSLNFLIPAASGPATENFIESVMENAGVQKLATLLPTQEVSFSNLKSKDDAFWRKEYDMPDFTTHATGSAGQIFFFNWDTNLQTGEIDSLINLLNHELGHSLATYIYGSPKPPADSEYAQAVEKDGGPDTHVSQYGRINSMEDFAESVSYALKSTPQDRKEFIAQNPNRFKAILNILNKNGDYATKF